MIILRKIQIQNNIVIGQKLTPNPNGVVSIFQTAHTFKQDSITVTWNGQALYSPEDFTVLNSNTVKFICDDIYLPKSADVMRATYERV